MAKDAQTNPPAGSITPADPLAAGAQIVDAVFDVELEEAIPLIEQMMATRAAQPPVPAEAELKRLLEALWNFFKAIDLVRATGDFTVAGEHLEAAVKEFDDLGHVYLRDLSVGMRAYYAAVVELRRLNIGASLDYFGRAKDYLKRAGKFSSRFEVSIAIMEPDALFVAGVQALMGLDTANAKVFIDQAATASEDAAQKHFDKGSPMFFTFMGQAEFHRAFYVFFNAYNDFNKFEYDKLAASQGLTAHALKAQELLQQGDLENVQVKNLLLSARAFLQLMESIRELAVIMQRVFTSTVKVDFKTLIPVQEKIKVASECFSKGGPQFVSLVRFCDQLSYQVQNLERLARPDKKDFGKYAGIISCALFLPVFSIVSLLNQRFHIGLNGYHLMGACLALSLIGGFGFGALRFKSFISSLFHRPGKR